MEVDSVHAGKQVRCPTCHEIGPIPIDGKACPPQPIHAGKVPPVPKVTRKKVHGVIFGIDHSIVAAFVFGIASIGSNFTCLGPIAGTVMAVLGLINVAKSKSWFRQSGLMLNLVGLSIGGGMLALRYFFAW